MATGAQTPKLELVDRIGNAMAFCLWGSLRLWLAGALCFPIVASFQAAQPAMALLVLPVLPFVLRLVWMPSTGRAVAVFYGRCLRWIWRLIVPAPLRRSGAAYLERRREARARAKAKVAAREARAAQLAEVARAHAKRPKPVDGIGAVATLGWTAVALVLAYLAFLLIAALPVSVAVILGALIIAAALFIR